MSLLDSYDDELFTDELDGDEDGYRDDPATFRLTDVLRQTLREDYADASDEELDDALDDMAAAMSPAEAFNFAGALSQIGKSAGQLLSDPAVASVVRSVAPVAGGALGTVIGGPVGTALGTQLGTIAAGALPVRPAPRPAVPPMVAPQIAADPVAAPVATAVAPGAASPVAGGSPAAAQALVLANQRELLQALLSAALGQHGRQSIGGIPVAKLLGTFSQIVGEAAADADELHYLQNGGDDESVADEDTAQAVYTSLVDADHLELAETLDQDGWD